jgi:glycosyltransferase involved in cell wall biosynthesis/O-antigen/teichoic acid export membrane protein
MSSAPSGHAPDRRSSSQARLVRGAGWMTIAAVVVGAMNYGYSTTLTWLLPAHAYSVFVSGQIMLTVCGTIAGAWLPWLIAQGIAEAPEDALGRRASISFAVLLGGVQGLLAATVVYMIGGQFTSGPTQTLLTVSAVAIFLSAVFVGWLQGLERFSLLATFLVGEVLVKVAVGLLLVRAGAGARGALAGFGVSSLVVIAGGLLMMGGDLRPRTALFRRSDLWHRAGWLLAVQTGVVVFLHLDVVLASILVGPGADLARYQVSTILGRIPLPLTVALAAAVFPELSASQGRSRAALKTAAEVFLGTTVPVAMAVATMPQAVIDRLFPSGYAGVSSLLPATAVTGVLLSAVYLVAILSLAARRFRRAAASLAAGIAIQVATVGAGLRLAEIGGLAFGAMAGAGCALVLLLASGTMSLLKIGRLLRPTAGLALTAMLLLLLREMAVLWCVVAGIVTLLAGWRMTRRGGHHEQVGGRNVTRDDRAIDDRSASLRILHLAFDDHRFSGSGGGAVRTYEVNRRLARRHDITVVTINYKGAEQRVEEGVRYVQVGMRWSYFGRIITYLFCLPLALRRYPSDLVVEDFTPPMSSALVPLWTRRPVVGMVQWLWARQKSRQYKLPFFLFEQWGVRTHRRLVAVSSGIAARLQALNPAAEIQVIPNGVEPQATPVDGTDKADLVFLGRIELEGKGIDLLLQAFAKISATVDANLVIAGEGRDQERVLQLGTQLGLGERLRLVGRVDGLAKSKLLADARLICVTSRFETSSLVALEAQATGTPVLAFDIPAIREVLAPDGGLLVPAFNVDAYAEAMLELLNDPERRRAMGMAGQQFVRQFHWDEVARRQELVYLAAVAAATRRP